MLVYKNLSPHLYFGGILLTLFVGIRASNTRLQETAEKQAAHAAIVHVIDETEPLFRAAFPDQDRLHFLASPAAGYHKNVVRANLWAVDCLDNSSVLLAHTLWDADSKRAMVFSPVHSRPAWQARTTTSAPISDAKSVALAREWAYRLSPLSHADVQSRVYRIERTQSIIRVRLRLPDGEAIIWLNEWTGEILSALVQDSAALPKQRTF
jgi:hypothetical protein